MKTYGVAFRYSPIYDEQCRAAFELLPKHERPYPDTKTVTTFMRRLEKEWQKNERAVFNAIQRFSGIKWTVKEHTCYVVGSGDPFSDPLTMPVFDQEAPIFYVADVLCHELIHRNLLEPAFAIHWTKTMTRLKKHFPKDTENTLVHVLVHAIHERIYLNLFSEDRLKRDKRIISVYPEYRRAWEIIEQVGAQKIIDTYLR
ncbi:MAG: hypothetical protein ABIO72_00140 [Patescibacteria group bacterium]